MFLLPSDLALIPPFNISQYNNLLIWPNSFIYLLDSDRFESSLFQFCFFTLFEAYFHAAFTIKKSNDS
ncbi:unnamed protein product [Meloidogyne enterolobii]|uniref:Uncharacterized protein n=1 Tax=Meloidogyne enterolobii TaxID=390850 RepID=A0ACB0YJF3_MELEN